MTIYGWDIESSGFNENLFVTIYPKPNQDSKIPIPDDLKDIHIVGKLVSDDESNNVNWESSLENMNAENKFSTTSALLQTGMLEKLIFGENKGQLSGRTYVSKQQSIQIFKGVEPMNLNLTIEFVALRDTYKEVEAPLQYLYKFQAPVLGDGIVNTMTTSLMDIFKNNKISTSEKMSYFGYIPFDLVIDYAGKRFNSVYVLTSVSTSRDKIRVTKDGHTIKRQVSLSFKSKKALERDDFIVKIK